MFAFAKSNYHNRLQKETKREEEIQKILRETGSSRDWAVRHYDEEQQKASHSFWQLAAGAVWTIGGRYYLNSVGRTNPILFKWFAYYPCLIGSFATGYWLYDKLRGHYLNVDHINGGSESNHTWIIDYKEKYNTKNFEQDENILDQNDVTKSPFEKLKENYKKSLNNVGLDGIRHFKRQGKDKDDINYLLGKVRNLENIVYLDEKELENVSNPVDLQIKIDSVVPKSGEKNVDNFNDRFLKTLTNFKFRVENLPKFRSDKQRLLGLPFLSYRLRQLPTPAPGSWQYNLFEEIYGFPYHYLKDSPDSYEKINKYNYHKLLHPSIIKKFDTESEEFDMFLRNLNFDNKTPKENAEIAREDFCRNLLPYLNKVHDEKKGRDIAHYLINKSKKSDYDNYLYNSYSNQEEERLFRLAEEAQYINKNTTKLHRTQYATINTSQIGLKKEELDEIINNPAKKKEIYEALSLKYQHYDQKTILDRQNEEYHRDTHNRSIMDLDPGDEAFAAMSEEDINLASYENYTSEEDEIINNYNAHFDQAHSINKNRRGKTFQNPFYYNADIDMTNYQKKTLKLGIMSPKYARFAVQEKTETQILADYFVSFYSNPKFAEFNKIIIPSIDYKDPEKEKDVIKRVGFQRFLERMGNDKSNDKEIQDFLEKGLTTDLEKSEPSNITEELIEQSLYEAQYTKKSVYNNEYKKLEKRNKYEIEALMKAVGFVPNPNWWDTLTPDQFKDPSPRRYEDRIQIYDPLFHLYSEIEHPVYLRHKIKEWREGSEIRFKMPYYPETKKDEKSFEY